MLNVRPPNRTKVDITRVIARVSTGENQMQYAYIL